MKCNPTIKCNWAVKETYFLGFWMTPTGTKPWKKIVGAILKIDQHSKKMDVCTFIDISNHYKSLYGLGCQHMYLTNQQSILQWNDHTIREQSLMRWGQPSISFIQITSFHSTFTPMLSDLQLDPALIEKNVWLSIYCSKKQSNP